MIIFINHLECPSNLNKNETREMAKMHVCNNTCWTIGMIANSQKEEITKYVETIMLKLLKILCVTRVRHNY